MSTILDAVITALEASSLGDDVQTYALAACTGELSDVLEGSTVSDPRRRVGITDIAGAAPAWLSAIRVEGFRGIASGDTLNLDPGPGLTLVVGRNGCGKSSYVEALEVALSGSSVRWSGRKHSDWKKGWANLHHPASKPVRVSATLTRDGVGPVTVTRTWTSIAAEADSAVASLSSGTLAETGWEDAVQATPPILSYSELGKIADARPIDLYTPLYRILGLERLTEALEALLAAKKAPEKLAKDWKTEAKALAAELTDVDDPRAEVCREALAKRAPDTDAIETVLLGGATGDEGPLAALRALAGVRVPTPERVVEVTRDLAAALQTCAALSATDTKRLHQTAELLEQALAMGLGPEDDCPLCGTETPFSADWDARATETVTSLRTRSAEASAAERALQEARRQAQRLATIPPALRAPPEGMELPDIAEAVTLWSQMAEAGDATLVAELRDTHALYAEAVERLSAAATTALAEAQDRWRPFHHRLSALVEQADAAAAAAAQAKSLVAARKFLADLTKTLREQRFAPIRDRAQQVWARLRQSSSVSIDDIRLGGSGKRGTLDLVASVDGTDAPALGVLSQGELNALGLALFLPRATSPESPFRFVVIDDPVQAMDSHKVDGLALLLAELAQDRQVVVFTHDPRLPAAVSRMQLDAKVIEVRRGERSHVGVHVRQDPVRRYLSDAHKAARASTELGDRVAGVLVAGHCRSALEAASTRVLRGRRLASGEPHAEVEALIRDTRGLQSLVALAKYDGTHQANKIFGALNNQSPRLADAFRAMKEGAHGSTQGYSHSLLDLIRDTERICHWVQA